MIPEDLVYTKFHAWVRQGEPLVEVGVTEPFLRRVAPLISLELPDPDDEMKPQLPYGEVEGHQESWRLYPPAEARIVEVNEELVWNHEKLLKDPYGEGWLLKVRVHDPEELAHLWSPGVYRRFCEDTLGAEFVDE
jgi:glycine cleavage system H protein